MWRVVVCPCQCSTLQVSTAATMAAAVPEMRQDGPGCSTYRPATTSFAFFGVDFVVDADLKPWLIEVNHEPQARPALMGLARHSLLCCPRLRLCMHAVQVRQHTCRLYPLPACLVYALPAPNRLPG